jgi:tetratricopeptide (TPR) repeat protein
VIGRKLSHYEILEPLGAGGMGEVYRARDSKLGRDVAIKVLPTDRALSENARRRFQREAMAASSLNHPNIITIHEINSQDNIDFIVMEYVRGLSLAAMIRQSRLAVPQGLRFCVQIADAVAKAHGAGIIHRDLKPGNVMITEDGLVKVLDFGLAKFSHDAGSEETMEAGAAPELNLTLPGSTTGTIAYMSPEQARGETVDFRSDIFSFGIVMFQMFSGELPFSGTNTMAVLHNLHFNPPRELASACPDAPKALSALIAKMLEKQPAKRVQTMPEVAAELRGIARAQQWSLSQVSGVAPSFSEFVPPAAARSNWLRKRELWVAAAVLILAGAIAGGRFLLNRRAETWTTAAEVTPADDNSYEIYTQARGYLDHYERPGNIDQSIKLLGRAIQLDPKSAASYAALSEAYSRKNGQNPDPQWMKLASEYAHQAVELNDDLALAHISLGVVEMKSGQAEEAEKQFRRAADLDPKSSQPPFWLGVLYDKSDKQRKQAIEELQHGLQLDPNNWQIYMELGLSKFQSADYKEAAANWEQALKLEPDNVAALENLGGVYHTLDRDDDAATALQHALEIQPSADGYNNLGTIRFYQGRYQDAVSAFEKTVSLAANNYDNWANLADAYRWTPGDNAKATQAYAQAIQLIREEIAKTPQDLDLRTSLAMYLAKNGKKQDALTELQPVEREPKKDAAIWYKSAVVYELCGHRDQALAALATAVKQGQSLSDIKSEPELASLRADPRYHLTILGPASSGH